MGAILGQLLSLVGGEAAKALFTKVSEWWKSEGKLLFVGWWQKRAGREEQRVVDKAAQLEREAQEVSRAQKRVEMIDTETNQRRESGTPPLYRTRKR